MAIKAAAKSHYMLTLNLKCDSFMITCAIININQRDPGVRNPPRRLISLNKSSSRFDLSRQECLSWSYLTFNPNKPCNRREQEKKKGISMIFQSEADLSTQSFRVLLSAAIRTHQSRLCPFYNLRLTPPSKRHSGLNTIIMCFWAVNDSLDWLADR